VLGAARGLLPNVSEDTPMRTAALLAGAQVLTLLAAVAAGRAAEPAPDGAQLYLAQCSSCHGIGGQGDGPDANLFLPGPRNLREGFLEGRENAEIASRILDGARRPLAFDPHALRARLARDRDLVPAREEHWIRCQPEGRHASRPRQECD
jgi:hypothetical protein